MTDFPKINELNQELIFKLGQKHPSIQHALQLWKEKHITWEQATYLMIWGLATSKEELSKQYMDALTYGTRPFVIPASNVSKNILEKIQPSEDY